MSMQEALEKVLADIEASTPEQLRAELEKHRNGDIAVALREASEFLYGKPMSTAVEVLKEARQLIASGHEDFVCHAIDRVGRRDDQYERTADAITRHIHAELDAADTTVITYYMLQRYPDFDPTDEAKRVLRLALIDFLIDNAECNRSPSFAEFELPLELLPTEEHDEDQDH